MEEIILSDSSDINDVEHNSLIYDGLIELARRYSIQNIGICVRGDELYGGVLTQNAEVVTFDTLYHISHSDSISHIESLSGDFCYLKPIDERIIFEDEPVYTLNQKTHLSDKSRLYLLLQSVVIHVELDEFYKSPPDNLKGYINITPWTHGTDLTIAIKNTNNVFLHSEYFDTYSDNTISIKGTEYIPSNIELFDDKIIINDDDYTYEEFIEEIFSYNILPPYIFNKDTDNQYTYPMS